MTYQCIAALCALLVVNMGILIMVGVLTFERLLRGIAWALAAAVLLFAVFWIAKALLIPGFTFLYQSLKQGMIGLGLIACAIVLLLLVAQLAILIFEKQSLGTNSRKKE